MYKCKKCHQALTKFDKDICPYCGTVRPLEGQSDETQDVTQIIEAENIKKDFIDYKPFLLAIKTSAAPPIIINANIPIITAGLVFSGSFTTSIVG